MKIRAIRYCTRVLLVAALVSLLYASPQEDHYYSWSDPCDRYRILPPNTFGEISCSVTGFCELDIDTQYAYVSAWDEFCTEPIYMSTSSNGNEGAIYATGYLTNGLLELEGEDTCVCGFGCGTYGDIENGEVSIPCGE